MWYWNLSLSLSSRWPCSCKFLPASAGSLCHPLGCRLFSAPLDEMERSLHRDSKHDCSTFNWLDSAVHHDVDVGMLASPCPRSCQAASRRVQFSGKWSFTRLRASSKSSLLCLPLQSEAPPVPFPTVDRRDPWIVQTLPWVAHQLRSRLTQAPSQLAALKSLANLGFASEFRLGVFLN